MKTLRDLDDTAQAIKAKTRELREQYEHCYSERVIYTHPYIGGQGTVEIPEFHLSPQDLSQMIFDVMIKLAPECDCGREVSRILENCISERDIHRGILEWLKEH